jgi:hypothetical protein
MVCSATFNIISVLSWRSVLLVEETGIPGENHQPVASHWQSLSHNVCVCVFHVNLFIVHVVENYPNAKNKNLIIWSWFTVKKRPSNFWRKKYVAKWYTCTINKLTWKTVWLCLHLYTFSLSGIDHLILKLNFYQIF